MYQERSIIEWADSSSIFPFQEIMSLRPRHSGDFNGIFTEEQTITGWEIDSVLKTCCYASRMAAVFFSLATVISLGDGYRRCISDIRSCTVVGPEIRSRKLG